MAGRRKFHLVHCRYTNLQCQHRAAMAAVPCNPSGRLPALCTEIRYTKKISAAAAAPQVDVDLVFSEGAPVYGAITDNWPTIEPYFNETGSNCPSVLPREQQSALMELGVQSVQALGLSLVRVIVSAPATKPR